MGRGLRGRHCQGAGSGPEPGQAQRDRATCRHMQTRRQTQENTHTAVWGHQKGQGCSAGLPCLVRKGQGGQIGAGDPPLRKSDWRGRKGRGRGELEALDPVVSQPGPRWEAGRAAPGPANSRGRWSPQNQVASGQTAEPPCGQGLQKALAGHPICNVVLSPATAASPYIPPGTRSSLGQRAQGSCAILHPRARLPWLSLFTLSPCGPLAVPLKVWSRYHFIFPLMSAGQK